MLLKDYHPKFLVESKIFGALLDTMQVEHDILESALTDLINQLYISTATWGLDAWEQFLGIETIASKSYTQRRSALISKLTETSSTTTQALKNAADAFGCGDISITESASTYSFHIKFSKGSPPNLQDFLNMVNELKPAHLAYTYEFSFMTWNMFDATGNTWTQWDALNLTWDQFEIYGT